MDGQKDRNENSFLRILLFPVTLILSLSPVIMLVAAMLIGLLGFGVYYSFNSDFLGLAAPPLAKLVFSSGYETVRDPDGRQWVITYESDHDTVFAGVVRHVSHWREEDIPFATHDILVTTGEFSSQERVHVSVMFHTFTYRYQEDPRPSGTINLLHIVPASPEIYRQLLEVRDWNRVSIRGREILRIERFDPHGNFLGAWQDAGCNSILVSSVEIISNGTPVE
jgi:hypothetical protein